ncbi:hypothetical protein HBH69_171110 [Parastagonospora nodorum]|nr:hypothetical protein HBH69_171110 [Parastagonospora nodorum]KAH5172968.1 hypothetical protein HBH77_210970 [Parastagonospora nodorum]KAH5177928.1 hypothetical protein HBH68_184960 [Parastagonospora nodorum]KAH5673403.1 hypothetical protein HBI21_151790 [Parastagonospora nodorum]KAH6404063.1 hypothetical protein HBI08_169070 [Parastagonospora nodorum]
MIHELTIIGFLFEYWGKAASTIACARRQKGDLQRSKVSSNGSAPDLLHDPVKLRESSQGSDEGGDICIIQLMHDSLQASGFDTQRANDKAAGAPYTAKRWECVRAPVNICTCVFTRNALAGGAPGKASRKQMTHNINYPGNANGTQLKKTTDV